MCSLLYGDWLSIEADKFEAKVSKQGKRKMINVPSILTNFESGDEVEVKKKKRVD